MEPGLAEEGAEEPEHREESDEVRRFDRQARLGRHPGEEAHENHRENRSERGGDHDERDEEKRGNRVEAPGCVAHETVGEHDGGTEIGRGPGAEDDDPCKTRKEERPECHRAGEQRRTSRKR